MKKWLVLLPFTAWAAGFAPDQRHLAPNARPFTALARTVANGGVGCGVLIGPDLLLTCAHCISDPQRQVYEKVEIELGVGFEAVPHKALLKEAYLEAEGSSTIDGGQDWAIVRLDRPLGAYYGWLNCRYLSDAEWPDAEVELLGYCGCPEEARPQFGSMDRPYRCPGAVSDVGPQIVFHNCAMWGGTSGAPLLARSGDSYSVVGVNFAGVNVAGEQLKHGFRETYRKDLANLAIPARNWRSTLSNLPTTPAPVLKTVWVQNAGKRPLQVQARYASIFAEPGAPESMVQIQIPAGGRKLLLERTHGCAQADIRLQVGLQKPIRQKLTGAETTLTFR
jgi:V8-like Glu-specific endopeptidase